jgi:hypothetical protein
MAAKIAANFARHGWRVNHSAPARLPGFDADLLDA